MMREVDGRIRRRVALALSLALAAVLQGCAAPVEYWHSQRLTEEFTSADAQRIASFEDYLALEERLFAQLDSKVHAAAGSGSSVSMLRYGEGGAADPRRQSPNWNRSFELRAAAPVGGVLLLHGMSDSPYSLRAIGQALHGRGYHVVGLRLPGHGTAPSGLTTVRWEDMAGATRLAMGHLASRLGNLPIHVIGYSTGATLALDFALDALDGRVAPVPASLVLISPAVGLHAAAGLAVWKRRLSMLPGLGGLAWLVIEPEFDPYKYNSFATNAGEQVHRLTRSVGRRLERRARSGPATMFPPTLVLKSNADATVSTDAVVDRLLGLLEADRHELVLFDVNRLAAKSVLKVYDPRALDTRVMGDATLPFGVVLVTNENDDSPAVVGRRQPPHSAEVSAVEPLGLAWPAEVLSLSHVALPFPPDDPLYGRRPPDNEDLLFLGDMAIRGERGMLLLSPEWLLRLRHNPFYPYLESAIFDWIERAGQEESAQD